MTPSAIRATLIEKSPLSQEFKLACKTNGFQTFGDLLSNRTISLLNLEGFSQRLIYEYVDFFERIGLGNMIDP